MSRRRRGRGRRRADALRAGSSGRHRGDGSGVVYCLSNVAMPGQVKLGFTVRAAQERADELSRPTGIPAPFVVAWAVRFADPRDAERRIHRVLRNARISPHREFFAVSACQALQVTLQVLQQGGA